MACHRATCTKKLEVGRVSKRSDQEKKKGTLHEKSWGWGRGQPTFHLKGHKINKQIRLRRIKKDKDFK